MKRLLAMSRLVDRFTAGAGRIASALVLLVTLVSVTNAALRYGVGVGSNAWLEAQNYMFAGLVYLGGAYTLQANEHIRVDVLYTMARSRTRLLIDIFGLLFFLLPVCAVLAWLSWSYFANSFASQEVSGNAGGLVLWPAKFFIPVGFGLLILQGLSELVKRVAALRGELEFDVTYEKPEQ